MNDDFYIGWSDQAPAGYLKARRIFYAMATIVFLLIAIIYTRSEVGFIDSYYEYGTLQEISGHLVSRPVWGLRTEEDGRVKTIPLVGFGKFGSEATIAGMMGKTGVKAGDMVTLRGMIFHYQGKKWMELTEMEESLVRVGAGSMPPVKVSGSGTKTYSGEIVDPKCFFGVMNPATKAVHRSCAIRCISGGIPPVLAIRENGVFVDYFFLVDNQMNSLGMSLVPYVGIPVTVTGKEMQYDDWKLLDLSPDQVKIAMMSGDEKDIVVCR